MRELLHAALRISSRRSSAVSLVFEAVVDVMHRKLAVTHLNVKTISRDRDLTRAPEDGFSHT
jgi:hypothetical protein